jgi:hypothetical protein
MPIDSRIALGYQAPQLESPVNMMMTAQKMQSGQQENALRQAQMENYQAEAARRNALLPSELDKASRDAATAKLTQQGKAFDIAKQRYDVFRKTVGSLSMNPNATKQDAVIAANGLVSSGMLDQDKADAMLGQLPDDPVALKAALKQSAMQDLTTEQMFTLFAPKPTATDAGNKTVYTDTNPYSPTYMKPVGSVAHGVAPMTAQQTAERNEAKDVVAREVTDSAGNVRFFNKFGDEIKTGTGKGAGKPTATYERTQNLRAQMKRDTDIVVAELKEISKDGGLIDQSTGSGFGRALDASAGFFGQETEGDIAIAKLQPIADKVVKMVPRFEGPQSDKDALSYQQAGGMLADPTLPTKRRKAAAREIVRLHTKYPNQFVTPEMAAEGTGPAGGEARAMSSEDKQALDWANANPNDARAAKIKQRLGM